MMKRDGVSLRSPENDNEARLADIAYHKKFNRWIVVFCSVIFLFFAGFHHYLGNYLSSFLFGLLFLNAVTAILIGDRIQSIENLIRLKRVSTAIAFAILAVCFVTGVLGDDVYIFFPWIFLYPIGVMFMFGRRLGMYFSIVFWVLMTATIIVREFPPWTAASLAMFKFNSVFALFQMLIIALFSEKARVRIQEDLVAAQNSYKLAEERQREINLELQQEIALRMASEKALAQSEQRYRTLFEESAVSLWEEDASELKIYLDGLSSEIAGNFYTYFQNNPEALKKCSQMVRVVAFNRATLNLFEADSDQALIQNIQHIFPSYFLAHLAEKITSLYHSGRHATEIKAQTINDRPLHLLITSVVPGGFESSWSRIYTSAFDNTDRVLMEMERARVQQQLQSAQQFQAVATLAGGIAHEFNNALAVIFGNLDLLDLRLQGNSNALEFFDPLKKSAAEMSQLTEQLLAYAKGGKYQPRDFSVNELILGVLRSDKMRPSPSIQIETDLAEEICATRGDVTQIKMVIEAVLSNAFESIPTAGKVTITTRNYFLDRKSQLFYEDMREGRYAGISIRDNGIGMDDEILKRIFEPFFTTKLYGRGLGMAASYGIVSNHKGLIAVQSKTRQGTEVMIYLPEHI